MYRLKITRLQARFPGHVTAGHLSNRLKFYRILLASQGLQLSHCKPGRLRPAHCHKAECVILPGSNPKANRSNKRTFRDFANGNIDT